MKSEYWGVQIVAPSEVCFRGERLLREDWIAILSDEFSRLQMQGVREDLCEDCDDWIDESLLTDRITHTANVLVEFYFETEDRAEQANQFLYQSGFRGEVTIFKTKNEDWDRKWKDAFQGVSLADGWEIVPPWKVAQGHKRLLVINPGSGFGTGTHETTQLCLEAFSHFGDPSFQHALDFGSGSGILSIAAAKQGLEVDAVEIDELAIHNAKENAALNSVGKLIHFSRDLGEVQEGEFDLIFANVLKNVLLAYSRPLVQRLKRSGLLILSGLLEPDVEPIVRTYRDELGARDMEKSHKLAVLEKNGWRAVVFF